MSQALAPPDKDTGSQAQEEQNIFRCSTNSYLRDCHHPTRSPPPGLTLLVDTGPSEEPPAFHDPQLELEDSSSSQLGWGVHAHPAAEAPVEPRARFYSQLLKAGNHGRGPHTHLGHGAGALV